MADGKTLHCNLITPDRQVLECEATSVVLAAHDGEIGFLKDRAPLLCKLGVGALRIASGAGDQRFFIDGGFAQMLGNELTILTEFAEASGDIDVAAVAGELREATALGGSDSASRAVKDRAVARARARKRIAG